MNTPSPLDLFDLEHPLDQISEVKFREIALLLEEARDQPEVQTIMERIRPRLKRVRPMRKPNLQRLFYQPFEDLLRSEPDGRDDGGIPRRAAQLAWEFVLAKNDAAERRIYKVMETRLRALEAGDLGGQSVLARRMWPSAAILLDEAASNAATNKTVRQELVGDQIDLIEGVRQIVRLLGVGEEIQLLKQALPPKPIRGLDISQMALIRQTVANGHDGKPDRAYAMLLAIMVRMSAPAEFLRRILHLNLDLPTPIKVTVFSRLGRTVLAAMDGQARALSAQVDQAFPERTDQAQRLVAELTAADQVLRDSDPTTRQQLSDLHGTAEQACAALVEEASQDVRAGLTLGAAAPVADLIASETAVNALRKCQTFARQVELERAVNQTLSALVRELKIKTIRLFEAFPDAKPAERPGVERDLYWCIRMLELSGDPDEADRIRLEVAKAAR
ncbi:MAG: hypothetical protein WCC64_17135 [Aliidongia sp.]